MKNLTTSLLLTSAILSSTLFASEEISIPKLESPSALQEGIQRELSAAQIAELLPWAKDSKIFLQDLMDQVHPLPMDQKIERLIDGIKQVVIESAPKHSELIMRYALNRALVLNDILNDEMTADAVGTADAKARILMASIKLALKYYDADMAAISAKTKLPYAVFGMEYFNFLHELNKSIFDASAQYNVQRTALEFLQWDLYRDLNNTRFAPQIVKINNALKVFPKKKMTDAHAINYIRQMKKTVEQLSLGGTKTDEINKESVVIEKQIVKDNVFKNGKFVSTYDSYYGTSYCYPSDKEGRKIGDAKVDISNCQSGFNTIYDSYYGTNYCYPVDKSGKKLGDSKADISKCQTSYVSIYDSYYGTSYCYPASKEGKRLGDYKADINKCKVSYVSIYDSYYGTNYCYPGDKDGKKLGDSKVDISFCQ